MSRVFDRVRQIAADVLQVDPHLITRGSGPETLAYWDSVQHLNLILAFEQEFRLEFEPEEIDQMNTIDQILIVLERKNEIWSNTGQRHGTPLHNGAGSVT